MTRRAAGGGLQVKTSTLEALRRLKTRHQRLLSAVSTLRSELESFLKDDDDIAKMCLSRRADLPRDSAAAGVPLSPPPPQGPAPSPVISSILAFSALR